MYSEALNGAGHNESFRANEVCRRVSKTLYFISYQLVLDSISHKMCNVVNADLVHDICPMRVDRSGADK